MKTFVLDASIALSWSLDKPVPALAISAKNALLTGITAVVPVLFHLEVANGLVVAERRGMLTSSDAALALLQLERLCAQALQTDLGVVSMRQALTTARAYQLSAYDSVYLDLALRAGFALATLDIPLRNAAVKAGVQLLS